MLIRLTCCMLATHLTCSPDVFVRQYVLAIIPTLPLLMSIVPESMLVLNRVNKELRNLIKQQKQIIVLNTDPAYVYLYNRQDNNFVTPLTYSLYVNCETKSNDIENIKFKRNKIYIIEIAIRVLPYVCNFRSV